MHPDEEPSWIPHVPHFKETVMLKILQGITVVCVALFLFAASQARANELRTLLQGKSVVYEGTCHLTKDGKFAETANRNYTVHRCIVGVDWNEPGEIYYALIYHEGKAEKLLRVNKDTKEQTIIWQKAKVSA